MIKAMIFAGLNKSMEKKTRPPEEKNLQLDTPNGGRGGAREGAGRKPGATDQLTVKGLLEALSARSGGQNYEELLADDFFAARGTQDKQLLFKYHQLITNKVMNSLAKVEITDSTDAIAAKHAAFAAALERLTGIKED
jgi:hypothetical protein